MNTKSLETIFNNSHNQPPLFGTEEQNEICESIFLHNDNTTDVPVSDTTLSFAKNFADLNNSNLIHDSIKNTSDGNFIFNLEKENDDCSGMEISQYSGNLSSGVKLQKHAVIKYVQRPMPKFDDNTVKLIKNVHADIVGTLNILSAVLENSNEDVKVKFTSQEQELRSALDVYKKFIDKIER